MLRLRRQHPVEAAHRRIVSFEVDLELVHALEIECDRPSGAVDLEPVPVLPARRHSRRLHAADRSALEPHQRHRRIVHRYGAALFGMAGERTFLHKCFEMTADLDYLSNEVAGEIYDVRYQVAERTGSRLRAIEAPDQRECGIRDPVLQIRSTEVPDGADPAGLDQTLRKHHGGDAPVVMADHVDDAGGVDRVD